MTADINDVPSHVHTVMIYTTQKQMTHLNVARQPDVRIISSRLNEANKGCLKDCRDAYAYRDRKIVFCRVTPEADCSQ